MRPHPDLVEIILELKPVIDSIQSTTVDTHAMTQAREVVAKLLTHFDAHPSVTVEEHALEKHILVIQEHLLQISGA